MWNRRSSRSRRVKIFQRVLAQQAEIAIEKYLHKQYKTFIIEWPRLCGAYYDFDIC